MPCAGGHRCAEALAGQHGPGKAGGAAWGSHRHPSCLAGPQPALAVPAAAAGGHCHPDSRPRGAGPRHAPTGTGGGGADPGLLALRCGQAAALPLASGRAPLSTSCVDAPYYTLQLAVASLQSDAALHVHAERHHHSAALAGKHGAAGGGSTAAGGDHHSGMCRFGLVIVVAAAL